MVVPLIAAGIAGGAALLGRRSANKANRREAQKNRAFQERMRNTEWQSAVADMEKAGINPALAYSQGGASSPSGSVAAKQESAAGEGVSSALAVKTATEQFNLLRAQTAAARAQSLKTQSEQQILSIDRTFAQSKMGMYFNGDGTPKKEMLTLLQSELAGKVATNARSVSELNLSQLRGPEMKAVAELFENVGTGGKGVQMIMPLLLRLLSRR